MKIFYTLLCVCVLAACQSPECDDTYLVHTHLSDTDRLHIIKTMQSRDVREFGEFRILVNASYRAASGALCKAVVIQDMMGSADHKLACFEGGRGRFVPSPFLAKRF